MSTVSHVHYQIRELAKRIGREYELAGVDLAKTTLVGHADDLLALVDQIPDEPKAEAAAPAPQSEETLAPAPPSAAERRKRKPA